MARNGRAWRREIAEDTLALLEREGPLAAAVARAREASVFYGPADPTPPLARRSAEPCAVTLLATTTVDALYRFAEGEEGPAVLNFASAKNPGGGFLGGSQAQEESLAKASGLYPCLQRFGDAFYAPHKRDPRGGFYSDALIVSPRVPFFKTDDGTLVEPPVHAAVITCPAVNAGVVGRQPDLVAQIVPTMGARLARVLEAACAQEAGTLVLGAWGCGVFKQRPEDVSDIMAAALAGPARHAFRHVVIAIPEPHVLAVFARALAAHSVDYTWEGEAEAEGAGETEENGDEKGKGGKKGKKGGGKPGQGHDAGKGRQRWGRGGPSRKNLNRDKHASSHDD